MGLIFDSTTLELVIGAVVLIWLYYIRRISNDTYWKDRSIAYLESYGLYGKPKVLVKPKLHIGQSYQTIYNQFKNEKVVGLFVHHQPTLVIRDPELLKQILTKDFQHFFDRGIVDPELVSPASRHLILMEGEPWKVMRSKLTPAFTSGKMKSMFHLMEACSNEFVKALEPVAQENRKIEIKDFIERFTTDVIASCAFGLEANSIKNPDNEFRENGKKFFQNPSTTQLIIARLVIAFPWVCRKLHIYVLHSGGEEFFKNLIKDTVAYREKSGVARNDFIDLFIKIKNNKSLYDDEKRNYENDKDKPKYDSPKDCTPGLTLDEMAAQTQLFFAAGFETSASAMSFCLYEISLNTDVQSKMRKEIDEIMKKHNGKLNYQALQDMAYMEAVINETLRLYASLPVLNRQVTKDYRIPDLNVVLPKGTKIIIPTYAIHHDPEYYPDPYKFDPERFTDEKIPTKNNFTFMPFGEGPRICLGMRFAFMQMKMCLSMLLHNYQLSITEDTPIPVVISKVHFFTTPESPIILKMSKRSE